MARLPGDDGLLMQQVDDDLVVLFNENTDQELLRFNPTDSDATAKAQKEIHGLSNLTEEQKSFAHFWSGYFYGRSA